MSRGRRRLPAEVHEEKGNPSKLKEETIEKTVQHTLELGQAEPLSKLSGLCDREEIADFLINFCNRLGFIKVTDSLIIRQLAEAIWEHNQATAEIFSQLGGALTYEAESYVNASKPSGDGKDGDEQPERPASRLIRVHPGVMIRRRARQDIERLCGVLGLTPGTRFALYEKALDDRSPAPRKPAQPGLVDSARPDQLH